MSSRLGITLILLVNAIFALIFSLGQLALVHSYPYFITGIRMLLGGVILLSYQKLRHPESLVIDKKAIWPIIMLAFFNIYLTNGPEIWGLQFISGAKTAFIYNLAPFISAFFAYLYFDERMNNKKWLGLLIAFIGFLPTLFSQEPGEAHLAHLGPISTADMAIIIATTASVYGWIIMQNIIRKKKCNTITANGVSMLLGAGFSVTHSLYIEPWSPLPFKVGGNWLILFTIIFLMVLFSNIIAYSAYAQLLRKYTSTFISFTSFSCYLFAAFYDWIFRGELVSWSSWLAAGVFFIGLYIFYKEELAQGYINYNSQ